MNDTIYIVIGRGCGKLLYQNWLMACLIAYAHLNNIDIKPAAIRKEKNMHNFMKKEPVKPVMSEHLKHVKIPQPMEINFESKTDIMSTMVKNMSARVADITDEVICNAIINFAKDEGITDLYLIDKKFIKRAIINEMNSMRFRELMQLPETELKKIRVVDEDEICALRNEICVLEKQSDDRKNKIHELLKVNEKLREELDNRDKQNEELFKENKELEAKLAWTEGERDAYYRRYRECHSFKDKYENLLKRMEKYEIIIDAVEKLCGCEFDI